MIATKQSEGEELKVLRQCLVRATQTCTRQPGNKRQLIAEENKQLAKQYTRPLAGIRGEKVRAVEKAKQKEALAQKPAYAMGIVLFRCPRQGHATRKSAVDRMPATIWSILRC